MIRALDISSSALVAQRIRMDVIAGNIANANVTRQDDGTIVPYRRRRVFFAEGRPDGGGPGVHVAEIDRDPSDFRLMYDPSHDDSIREGPLEGYVQFPNVNSPPGRPVDTVRPPANIPAAGVCDALFPRCLPSGSKSRMPG